jgi:uncharacterized HAD superfamily protein
VTLPTVIVDIDGVLADGYPALEACSSPEGTDWELYHDLMRDAPLCKNGVPELVRALVNTEIVVVLLTCRGEHKHHITRAWLENNDIPYDDLIHKRADVEHYEHKVSVITELRRTGHEVFLAIEDDPVHVEQFRALDIAVMYVHSGHYEDHQPWRSGEQLLPPG